MKHSITYLLLFCILPFFATSCEEEDIEEIMHFNYGITSQTSSSHKDIAAISMAYTNAFEDEGLMHYNYAFPADTPESSILKACHEAESAILTSSIKFDGRYKYEVIRRTKNNSESIYKKVYGVKRFD